MPACRHGLAEKGPASPTWREKNQLPIQIEKETLAGLDRSLGSTRDKGCHWTKALCVALPGCTPLFPARSHVTGRPKNSPIFSFLLIGSLNWWFGLVGGCLRVIPHLPSNYKKGSNPTTATGLHTKLGLTFRLVLWANLLQLGLQG